MSSIVSEIVDRHRHREGPLLRVLNDIQEEMGHVSEEAIREIAHALNLTRAEVHGVVSFYHDYKTAPDARPVVKLCRAEACQARGVESLIAGAEAAAGDRVHIETVYCLGLCSVGPAALVGGKPHARLDQDKLNKLVATA